MPELLRVPLEAHARPTGTGPIIAESLDFGELSRTEQNRELHPLPVGLLSDS